MISWDDFTKVEMRVGTVLEARVNERAKKPAYVLKIDFGEYGIKTTSAQITVSHKLDELPGTQVVAVLNFPVKNIAGVQSEVLVLGAVSETKSVVLLRPQLAVENGTRIA